MKTKMSAILFGVLFTTFIGHAGSCYDGPQVGDVVRGIVCDTTGVSQGAAGQNVTWTVTTTCTDTNPYNGYYVDPSATPFAASFPTATLAAHQSSKSGLVTYSYTRITPDSSISLGAASTAINLPYSDPLATPLCKGYGESYTDTYADAYTTTTSPGASTVTHSSATITSTFDGEGKLVLPWITFTHAVRSMAVTVRYDSTWTVIASYKGPVSVVTTTDTSYTWLDTTLARNHAFSISHLRSHAATPGAPSVDINSKVVVFNEPVSAATATLSAAANRTRTNARFLIQDGGLLIRRNVSAGAADLFDMQGKKAAAAKLGSDVMTGPVR